MNNGVKGVYRKLKKPAGGFGKGGKVSAAAIMEAANNCDIRRGQRPLFGNLTGRRLVFVKQFPRSGTAGRGIDTAIPG